MNTYDMHTYEPDSPGRSFASQVVEAAYSNREYSRFDAEQALGDAELVHDTNWDEGDYSFSPSRTYRLRDGSYVCIRYSDADEVFLLDDGAWAYIPQLRY